MNKINQTPLVSIIINCYNGEKYLHKALQSVQKQTYQNWEVIFWDNLSTDKSKRIFFSFSDKRFKYNLAKKHTNLYTARNLAIRKAKGQYIAFLDVDDWWDKNKLSYQIPYFIDEKVALVYGNCWIVDERDKKKTYLLSKKELPKGYISKEILKNYNVSLPTIIINKKLLGKKIFDENFHIIGDFDLVIRISFKWKIECCQLPIAFNRIHKKNESLIKYNLQTKELETWLLKRVISQKLSKKEKSSFKNLINYRKCNDLINYDIKKSFLYFNLLPISFLKVKIFIKMILFMIKGLLLK